MIYVQVFLVFGMQSAQMNIFQSLVLVVKQLNRSSRFWLTVKQGLLLSFLKRH